MQLGTDRQILKYNIAEINKELVVNIPIGSRFLMFGSQFNPGLIISVWFEAIPNTETEEHRFIALPTGADVPKNAEHIQSMVCVDDYLVFHLYKLHKES